MVAYGGKTLSTHYMYLYNIRNKNSIVLQVDFKDAGIVQHVLTL